MILGTVFTDDLAKAIEHVAHVGAEREFMLADPTSIEDGRETKFKVARDNQVVIAKRGKQLWVLGEDRTGFVSAAALVGGFAANVQISAPADATIRIISHALIETMKTLPSQRATIEGEFEDDSLSGKLAVHCETGKEYSIIAERGHAFWRESFDTAMALGADLDYRVPRKALRSGLDNIEWILAGMKKGSSPTLDITLSGDRCFLHACDGTIRGFAEIEAEAPELDVTWASVPIEAARALDLPKGDTLRLGIRGSYFVVADESTSVIGRIVRHVSNKPPQPREALPEVGEGETEVDGASLAGLIKLAASYDADDSGLVRLELKSDTLHVSTPRPVARQEAYTFTTVETSDEDFRVLVPLAMQRALRKLSGTVRLRTFRKKGKVHGVVFYHASAGHVSTINVPVVPEHVVADAPPA